MQTLNLTLNALAINAALFTAAIATTEIKNTVSLQTCTNFVFTAIKDNVIFNDDYDVTCKGLAIHTITSVCNMYVKLDEGGAIGGDEHVYAIVTFYNSNNVLTTELHVSNFWHAKNTARTLAINIV